MENSKKDLTYLNSKWWYRLIKVVFVFVYVVIVITSAVAIYYDNKPTQKNDYLIQCNYGSKDNFYAWKDKSIYIADYNLRDGLSSLPDYKKQELRDACHISESEISKKLDDIFKGVDNSVKLYDIFTEKVIVGSYLVMFISLLCMLLVVTIVFEIIRRVFYYIFLGKLFPGNIKKYLFISVNKENR